MFEDISWCLFGVLFPIVSVLSFEKNNQKDPKRDDFPEWIEDLCQGKVAEVFLSERELDLEQVSINQLDSPHIL